MKFTIDYSKWRCGGIDKKSHQLGKGTTALLNELGYMCCLGQCSLQTIYSIKDIDMKCTPRGLRTVDGIFNFKSSFSETTVMTDLSREAMALNDSESTTPKEKIVLLKDLFKNHGHELEFINVPNFKNQSK